MSIVALSPFTGLYTNRIWGIVSEKKIWQCEQTGAFFYDRKEISPSSYQDYYPYLENFDRSRAEYELKIRRKRYNRQLDKIEKIANKKGIHLDIGAGPGYFCSIAMGRGWESYGVELSAEARSFGEKHFCVKYADLDSFSDGSVGLVTLHHVLEHIANPRQFLCNIKRVLCDGGILEVHVPTMQSLYFLIRENLRLFKNKQRLCDMYSNEHISGFYDTSLENVMAFAGFSRVNIFNVSHFSSYSDPWFVGDSFRKGESLLLFKKIIAAFICLLGAHFSRGHWVIGQFIKRANI